MKIKEKLSSYHSDQVKHALKAIPGDIIVSLTEEQLVDLTESIIEFGKKVTKDYQSAVDKHRKQ